MALLGLLGLPADSLSPANPVQPPALAALSLIVLVVLVPIIFEGSWQDCCLALLLMLFPTAVLFVVFGTMELRL